jgi:putative colanic acid biosynthesis UDP-glucose lipid carrier transferase
MSVHEPPAPFLADGVVLPIRLRGRPSSLARLPAVHDEASEPKLRLAQGARRSRSSRLKRAIDVVGALFGLVLLAPLLAAIALLVRLDSPGPAIFRQWRTGKGGTPFQIYKFRTMRVSEDGAEVVQAKRRDCRVTRLGAFLRQSCFDELPQLFNVLKGEMSLVGPRPHAVAHDRYYGALVADYDDRFLVRPGISGLAQVSGYRGETPNVEAMAGRVALDLDYIRSWSLGLDLRILVRTAFDGPFHPTAY